MPESEYKLQEEIVQICSDPNLQTVKNSIINLEKLLIQKKIKLDKFENSDLQQLVKFFSKIL